ncbi:MAG: tRNA dihydrouridine synthase DusB [Firmicutes bacterium]|nr:tRNA dihydrouridine synthase DusB [Bacillota bacterium]
MRIGKVTLKNKVILAPMAGVTDSIFRQLALEMGCALVYTEMISAKGLVYGAEQTLKMLEFQERPVAVQLFGNDPAAFAAAAEICARYMPDFIDVNMGCPVKKVVTKGEGSALMRNPRHAYAIVQALKKAVEIPITVKMRTGWDENSINVVEVAVAVQEAGASAIAVHGRTRAQGYSGTADWFRIKEVKDAVKIPVIGNGDIWRPEDARRMLQETGCDAVMLGRGVLGNPWLIRRTVHYLATGELLPEPGLNEKINMALRHLELAAQAKGEFIAVREMRKHIAWYLKGVKGAAAIRNKVMKAITKKEVKKILLNVNRE